ncbi:BatD family protein [Winogradskyella sp. UBA3174]|uniref:BatD family protein n=1 Tax=Winogradskyella sp. UBA3174 TaxID=1947785 RepID=UPI0025D9ACF9|nr:BatD family protein [Winogradskyella sp. UBA3174]|tara:strand:- start:22440 stop:24209 length:1770 start_codon:yes stop_codon:yes gene_type:complete
MKFIKHISILLLLLATSLITAQVKFEAKVSKKKLGVNERLRIDFEMDKDGDNFVPPSFTDFDVVNGPITSVSNSWFNGKRSYKKTYSYFLSPKKRGRFKIKQALIEIDGETFKTFPVTVNVVAAVDRPNGPPSAADVASDKIHLVAEVSKANPYLNEAITVVYKLYVSPEIGVSNNWREKDIPRYNDFWSQNIEIKGLKIQNAKYKGEDYRYVVLRKTVLYPQKAGALKLEPLVMDITVEVPSNRVDIFGAQLMTKIPQVVTAGNRIINVKPLPEQGKPSDFTGAVGNFNFKVTTTKTALDATESLQAKIEVSGKGNLNLFELPKLTTPSSLEVYEPEHKENVRTNLGGMQGAISDTYTIVPQFKGKYPIPSVSFSYFDLKTESYKRVTSDEIVIDVLNGPSANSNDINSAVNKKEVVRPNTNTFAFIKTASNWTSINETQFFKSTLFWLLLLLPFLLIPTAIVLRRSKDKRDADVSGNRIRKADRLAKKYLSKAKKALGQKEPFYMALEKALHNYLKAKLNIETSDFSKEKIEILLKQKRVDQTVYNEFISILENCESARYSPITKVTMQNDFDKAAKTISLIDKQIR